MAREGSAWASSEIGKSFTGWAFGLLPEAFGQYEAALSLGLHCRWA